MGQDVAMNEAAAKAPPPVAWKAVALPNEHGGWGLLAEPLLLGLLLAPTAAGACLAGASLGAFLARHPLRLALSDRRRGSRQRRTAAAERMALAYTAAALAFAAAALALAGPRPWLPLLAVAPLAAVQVAFDARLQGRRLAPELCGGLALAALAPAVLMAGGWPAGPSLAAGALVAAKAVTSVLYVRSRLRLDRGLEAGRATTLAAHVAAVAAAALLAGAGLAPWLGAAATVGLLARAIQGLSPGHRRVRPQVVGIRELVFGLAFTAALAAGYAWGI